MTERTMLKADLVTAIVLIAFSAAVFVMSVRMPTMTDRNESRFSGPGVVPAVVGAAIFLLSASLLVRSVRRGAVRAFGERNAGAGIRDSHRRVAGTIALCVAYALLLGRIWFPLVTFLFITAFVMLYEYDFKAAAGTQWKTPAAAHL